MSSRCGAGRREREIQRHLYTHTHVAMSRLVMHGINSLWHSTALQEGSIFSAFLVPGSLGYSQLGIQSSRLLKDPGLRVILRDIINL